MDVNQHLLHPTGRRRGQRLAHNLKRKGVMRREVDGHRRGTDRVFGGNLRLPWQVRAELVVN